MKRKTWLGVLSLVCVVSSAFALASCEIVGGEKGDKGDKGAGIASTYIDENGKLVITLTDGTVLDGVDLPILNGDTESAESLRFQKIADKDEYRVMGIGTISSLDIVIPATYRGLPVTEIGAYAFQKETYIRSIEIPDSVTSIGDYAFARCTSLTSVEIGDSVTSIGNEAFYSCDSLTSITFSDTSTWYRTDDYDEWNNKTGGTQMDVTNASTNATNFKSTDYYCYYWYKL